MAAGRTALGETWEASDEQARGMGWDRGSTVRALDPLEQEEGA